MRAEDGGSPRSMQIEQGTSSLAQEPSSSTTVVQVEAVTVKVLDVRS